jgi:MFS family permease
LSSGLTKFDIGYARRTLIILGLVVLTVFYIEIMLSPSIPTIRLQYGVTVAQASLILALYTVFGTAIAPVVGKLGDIYGKKKMLTYVLIAYSAMVTLTSFTTDFNSLLISRTFQGVGISIVPLAFSLAREEFPRELIPRAQALISGMIFTGIGVGLSGGAFISNYFGWQANYHVATPIVVVLTVVIIYSVRESPIRNPGAKLDYLGSAIFGASLAMVVLGLSQGSQWGWTSGPIVFLLMDGSALLLGLVIVEKQVKAPLLDFGQLGLRNVVVSNVLAVTTGTTIVLGFSSLAYKLEDIPPSGYGFDILTTGFYLLPIAIVVLLVAYPLGILNSKFGVKPFLILGSIIGGAGSILLSFESAAIQIPEFLSVISLGFGMLLTSRQILLVLSVRPTEMGAMTSLNQVFFNVGQSLGPAISAAFLTAYTYNVTLGGHTYTFPTTDAFQYTFLFGTVVFVVSLLVAVLAKEVIGRRPGSDLPS